MPRLPPPDHMIALLLYNRALELIKHTQSRTTKQWYLVKEEKKEGGTLEKKEDNLFVSQGGCMRLHSGDETRDWHTFVCMSALGTRSFV